MVLEHTLPCVWSAVPWAGFLWKTTVNSMQNSARLDHSITTPNSSTSAPNASINQLKRLDFIGNLALCISCECSCDSRHCCSWNSMYTLKHKFCMLIYFIIRLISRLIRVNEIYIVVCSGCNMEIVHWRAREWHGANPKRRILAFVLHQLAVRATFRFNYFKLWNRIISVCSRNMIKCCMPNHSVLDAR